MIIQLITSYIAVVAFSINLEIPKRLLFIVGIVGTLGWISYITCIEFGAPEIFAYFISALLVAIFSNLLAIAAKASSTFFLIPGILPIVPGVAMYNLIYAIINDNIKLSSYYLLQVLLITGGIALAIFITESAKNIKIIRKENQDEN